MAKTRRKTSDEGERRWATHHDVVPLVEFERQVVVGLDPLGVGRVHDRLAGRTDGDGLGQLRLAGARHPGHFRSKVGDVVLLLLPPTTESHIRNDRVGRG